MINPDCASNRLKPSQGLKPTSDPFARRASLGLKPAETLSGIETRG